MFVLNIAEVSRASFRACQGCASRQTGNVITLFNWHVSKSLNDRAEDASGGKLSGEHVPRKVFGTHADYLIGFLQRVDNLEFATYRLPTDLE